MPKSMKTYYYDDYRTALETVETLDKLYPDLIKAPKIAKLLMTVGEVTEYKKALQIIKKYCLQIQVPYEQRYRNATQQQRKQMEIDVCHMQNWDGRTMYESIIQRVKNDENQK
jgi:hypothetical protein